MDNKHTTFSLQGSTNQQLQNGATLYPTRVTTIKMSDYPVCLPEFESEAT